MRGALSSAETAAVEDHLDGCASCRQLVSELARRPTGRRSPVVESTLVQAPEGASASRPARAMGQRVLGAGARVGRYVVVEALGAGGMGVVYAARDPELNRKIALKLLHGYGPGTLGSAGQERLLAEARAMAGLSHPNVITVHDVGALGDDVFVAMELVEGPTLKGWLAEKSRSVREVLAIFVAAGRGLAAAHRVGLVHRDFKPENVMVGADGRVRVTDFGLARWLMPEADRSTPLRTSGIKGVVNTARLAGTVGYMAPEQIAGVAIDARSDQFSFCAALFEALYQRKPWPGRTIGEYAIALGSGLPPDTSGDSQVPGWLRRVVLTGLSRDHKNRHRSMDALLALLEMGSPATRRWKAAAAGAAVVAAVMAAVIVGRRPGTPGGVSGACDGLQQQGASAWDTAQKEALRRAFQTSARPFAGDVLRSVERSLDAYRDQWIQAATSACGARPDSHRAVAAVAAELSCLEQRLADLRALSQALIEADDAVVAGAARAAQALPSIAGCARASERAIASPTAGAAADAGARPQDRELAAMLAGANARLELGKLAEGVALAETAVTRARSTGEAAPLVEALRVLARLHERSGEFREAEQAAREAIVVADAAGDDRGRARALILMVSLAGLRDGRLEEGEMWAQQATAAVARLGSPSDLAAAVHQNVANLLTAKGRYADAVERHRQALALYQQMAGSDLSQANTLSNMGVALVEVGQYQAAEAALLQALAARERILGLAHPDLAMSYINLALVHGRMGLDEKSAREDEQALAIQRKTLSPDHPNLILSMVNVAQSRAQAGRFDEAIDLHRQALTAAQKVFGRDHITYAMYLESLADTLREARRYEEALATYEQAISVVETKLGKDHVRVGLASFGLGKTLIDMGAALRAMAPLERAVGLLEHNDAPPADRGDAYFALARALWARPAQRPRARDLAEKASAAYAKAEGPRREKALAAIARWLDEHRS